MNIESIARYKLGDMVIVIDPDITGTVVMNIEKIVLVADKNGTKVIYNGGIWAKLKDGWAMAHIEFAITEERISGLYRFT